MFILSWCWDPPLGSINFIHPSLYTINISKFSFEKLFSLVDLFGELLSLIAINFFYCTQRRKMSPERLPQPLTIKFLSSEPREAQAADQ